MFSCVENGYGCVDFLMLAHFPVCEFHCIMPIGNISSVMQRGILSHNEASKLPHAHESVADEEVQLRRARVHHFANLYFHARNPMMYKLRFQSRRICVLAVDFRVLSLPDVRLTDMNAAKSMARFFPVWQWQSLDFDMILARSWQDEDENRMRDKKARRCAEILIPNHVPPSYITHAYVQDSTEAEFLRQQGFDLPIILEPDLFFL